MAPTWSTACPDWKERILAGRSLLPCGPLFPEVAEESLEVLRDLPLVDVLDKPTFGEASRPWVFDLPTAVFGALNPETGRREINEFFLLISKKNGKSTEAAGIMVTELLKNQREAAKFIIIAPTLQVANNSSEPAMDFVAEHPELKKFLKPVAHERKIVNLATKAELKIVAAESDTVGGIKATGIFIDELWLFGKRPKARNMIREAKGGMASRPEGFIIAATTQSDEPPEGVFKDWLRRFRDIRDGKLKAPRSLGLLYEFPEEMVKAREHEDPRNFYVTNPNLGASVDEQFLLDELEKAQREGPKSLVGFYAKHLNVEPGMGARSDGWPGAAYWKRRADKKITLDRMIERCEVIVVGLDGGGLDDLYGMGLVGREKRSIEVAADGEPEEGQAPVAGKRQVKPWISWAHAWAHRIVLERRKSIAEKLEALAEAGEITIVEDEAFDDSGWPVDIAEIVSIVKRIKDAGLLCCVAVDPAGLGDLVEALAEIGVVPENREQGFDFVVGVQQGVALMYAIKTTERKLASGTFRHADQALMDWCVDNLKIEPTATAIRATKQNAGDAKVDPAMAMFNAAHVMCSNPDTPGSVYEERGLLII